MNDESKLISVILMMIGGASGSTAGGIKVVTMGVIVLSVVSSLKANEKIVVFGRRISPTAVNNAMMLFALWFLLIIGASLFISRIGNFSMIDSMYEAASAYGTAGLSVGVTAAANVPVKLLLIAYMFFGRVGVTTISLVFITRKRAQEKISYPEGKVIIG